MRIVHLADVHIRNHKYRDEYAAAFDDLYGKLEELRPDLVVNCGDTVHSKLAVSPELFDDVARHMREVSEWAPYWLILGNHDLNLKNRNRLDAISPIVSALRGSTAHPVELLGPGHAWQGNHDFPTFKFWNYDIRGHKAFDADPECVNIGLYHGSVAGCITDLGHALEDCEAEVSKFDAMDFVLLGDIHKRQSFRDGRIQYPGSLIQQNYGEELEKGFLLWEIHSKDEFSVEFHPVAAPHRFHTVQVQADLDISGIDVPSGSRIKALVAGDLPPSKRWELEKLLRERFSPLEIITPDSSADREATIRVDQLVGSRDRLAREYLKGIGCDDAGVETVMGLFQRYSDSIGEGSPRGTTWKLNRIAWDNMLNYGEENAIDLTRLGGVVGIFAPNASGKSSIFDILLQALFDRISKDVPRNIDLVNDNRDSGKMRVELESNGRPYVIERVIERISYGQRKLQETKQWGKTSLDFSVDDEQLNGQSRPETERAIRQIIGSFEDFVLTTMVSQSPIMGLPGGADILGCKETDRRKILFRFLDLDSYESIHAVARDDLKLLMGGLKADRDKLAMRAEEARGAREEREREVDSTRAELALVDWQLDLIRRNLAEVIDAERADRELREAEGAEAELRMMLGNDTASLIDADAAERDAEEDLRAHVRGRPDDPDISLEDLAARASEIEGRIRDADKGLSDHRSRERQGKRSLETLEGIPCEGKFPTCRFISDATTFLDQREVIRRAIEELTATISAAESERAGLDQHRVVHRRLSEWMSRYTQLSLKHLRAQDRTIAARATVESRTRLLRGAEERTGRARQVSALSSMDRVRMLRDQEFRAVAGARELQDRIDSSMRALGIAQANDSAARAELLEYDTLKERAQVHERLVSLCGKNGLPYLILARALPAINAEISKILNGIVRFTVFFEDDPEEQTVSLYIRYGDYRSRPLSLGSGAEKFIASLAIRAALLNVSSLPKTDILIVDEGFGKLDPEHLEAVNRILESLRGSFRTIFLISHVDSMRDTVDHSIDIISRAGYAHVDVT